MKDLPLGDMLARYVSSLLFPQETIPNTWIPNSQMSTAINIAAQLTAPVEST